MRTSVLISIMMACGSAATFIFCEPLVIEKPHTRERLSLAVVYEHDTLYTAAQQIKKLLMSTGLFDITLIQSSAPASTQEITAYMRKGCSVVLFIQPSSKEHHLAWRLYDATDASMLLGKNTGSEQNDLTHRLIADAVYHHLFNHPSYFLTKIAYIKKSPTLSNKKRTELCVLDPVDGAAQTILRDNRILVAPQWSRTDIHDTVWLAVSEFTPGNVRLLGCDLQGTTWPILDVDGTCVGTAQQDDATYVYVRSGVLWLYEFDKKLKKGRHTKLTDSRATCGCPSLLRSGDIIYSSNNKLHRYDRHTKKSVQLPVSGTCIAPDVHQPTGRILFSRSVNGVLQVHSCDSDGTNVLQLTHGPGNKIDACWSPCGNYIAYTRCHGTCEQIAVYNCMTCTEKIVTPEHHQYGYPSWSASSIQLFCNK